MLSAAIDLHRSPHLRLLQFNLHLDDVPNLLKKLNITQWFNSVCESVISTSLVVEVCDSYKDWLACNRIQDTLLALYERMDTFLVYLAPGTRERGLFSKLYEAGIVVEESIWEDEDKQVGHNILTSYLSHDLYA